MTSALNMFFGARGVRGYEAYTVGTYTCSKGSGDATQATANLQPAQHTLAGGQTGPNFDGESAGNPDRLATSGGITGLAVFDGTNHNRLMCGLLKFDSAGNGTGAVVAINTNGGLNNSDSLLYTNSTNRIIIGSASSNATPLDSTWHAYVIYKNGTGALTMEIDGVAQSTTGTEAFGQYWRGNAFTFGTQPISPDRAFDGQMASWWFAYDTTTAFSATDRATVTSLLLDELYANSGIQFIAAGAAAAGTTSTAPAYPAGAYSFSNDLIVLGTANKYPTNGPTTPSPFTRPSGAQGSGGNGSAGADSGTVYATVDTRVTDGTELPTATETVTIGSGNSALSRMLLYRCTPGNVWSVAAVNGANNSAGASVSVTASSGLDLATGDLLVVVYASNTDARTYASQAVSATGATFGSAVERQDSATGNGDDCALIISEHPVTAGSSSAAPVFTMTASGTTANQNAGAAVFLRLRELTPTIGSLSAAGTSTASITGVVVSLSTASENKTHLGMGLRL